MPKTLSKTNIAVNETVFAANVTQSIDAFTATPSGVVGQLMASGSATACKLYFHNGTEFKEIAFV